MEIIIGGLGQTISAYCPVCSEKMSHWCNATLGKGSTIWYDWKCKDCQLSLKSDKNGNAKLLKEVANV